MIRIIAGRWGGRRIATPRGQDTRPAAEAHRGAVLNSLAGEVEGARVLDLFAGSGAFGLECLSRGAAGALFVELGRDALATVRGNVELLGPDPGTAVVLRGDAYRLKEFPGGPFDLVFVAPPYPHFRTHAAELARVLCALGSVGPPQLAPGGTVVLQAQTGDLPAAAPPGLVEVRRKRFGRTEFAFYGSSEVS